MIDFLIKKISIKILIILNDKNNQYLRKGAEMELKKD